MRLVTSAALAVASFFIAATVAAEDSNLVPTLVGKPWVVARKPDVGKYAHPKQEPVDFAVWQAADGTWQLWSCIRNTKIGGRGHVLHRWEGQSLTDTNWKAMGIAMTAAPELGEDAGGLQAPFVLKHNGEYLMFYGDWNRICLATSKDGKQFTRKLNSKGDPSLFADDETFINCRDPMVLRIGDLWYCYYCVSHAGHKGKIYCRTSPDLKNWGEPKKVTSGSECPFVVRRTPDDYYIFRTHHYAEKPVMRVVGRRVRLILESMTTVV